MISFNYLLQRTRIAVEEIGSNVGASMFSGAMENDRIKYI